MGRAAGLMVPVFVLATLASLSLTGCETPPNPRAVRVVVTWDSQRTWIEGEGARYPLGALDRSAAVRLAGALFPEVTVHESPSGWSLDFDAKQSAAAYLEASRWTDGIVLAQRGIEKRTGAAPITNAGVIAEQLRRYMLAGPMHAAPDWTAVAQALEDDHLWETTPNTAGMGAIVLSGLILRGEYTTLSRDLADKLMSRATAAGNFPDWLSYIAWLNWSTRDYQPRAKSS
jgi:hypothetical protein